MHLNKAESSAAAEQHSIYVPVVYECQQKHSHCAAQCFTEGSSLEGVCACVWNFLQRQTTRAKQKGCSWLELTNTMFKYG